MRNEYSLIFAFVAVGLMLILGWGCSSDSDDLNNKQEVYLDFDPLSNEELTSERIKVISEALLKISEFVIHDGSKTHITTTAKLLIV